MKPSPECTLRKIRGFVGVCQTKDNEHPNTINGGSAMFTIPQRCNETECVLLDKWIVYG